MTFRRTSLFLAVAVAAVAGVSAQSTSGLADRVAAIHKAVPVIDGHNDYPWALREKSPGRDLRVLDIRQPQPSLMTDIARLRAGGVGGQFWSVYVPATMQGKEAVRATLGRSVQKIVDDAVVLENTRWKNGPLTVTSERIGDRPAGRTDTGGKVLIALR